MGRLVAGALVVYLNIQGAWVVASVLAATGIYFASAVSFSELKEIIEERWLHLMNWHDRWRNWREERAEMREAEWAEREAEQEAMRAPARSRQFAAGVNQELEPEREEVAKRPSWLAVLFGRRKRVEPDAAVDEIPAYRRGGFEDVQAQIPVAAQARRPGRPSGPCQAPAPHGPAVRYVGAVMLKFLRESAC